MGRGAARRLGSIARALQPRAPRLARFRRARRGASASPMRVRCDRRRAARVAHRCAFASAQRPRRSTGSPPASASRVASRPAARTAAAPAAPAQAAAPPPAPGRRAGAVPGARSCARSRRLSRAPARAVVRAAYPHPAVALEHGPAAAPLAPRHAHRVLHRAPLAGEVGHRDAAGAALVHATHPVLGQRHGEQGRLGGHQLLPFTFRLFFTVATPSTPRATDSARCLVASVSTMPFSVTAVPALSTSMFQVLSQTSAARAAFTLPVSSAFLLSRLISDSPLAPLEARSELLGSLAQPATLKARAATARVSPFMSCPFRE